MAVYDTAKQFYSTNVHVLTIFSIAFNMPMINEIST